MVHFFHIFSVLVLILSGYKSYITKISEEIYFNFIFLLKFIMCKCRIISIEEIFDIFYALCALLYMFSLYIILLFILIFELNQITFDKRSVLSSTGLKLNLHQAVNTSTQNWGGCLLQHR